MLEHKYPDLKLEDLKVGMRVKSHQLDRIYDTHILLTNLTEGFDGITYYLRGQYMFIGTEQDDEYEKARGMCGGICFIYNEEPEEAEETPWET